MRRAAALAWSIWRAEGTRALLDRLADRLADRRRRRTFRRVDAPPKGIACPVLNLSAAEPTPRRGGVEAQLLWRLTAEARVRPVALLYPEPTAGGRRFRLEIQRGEERFALYCPPATLERPGGAAAPRQPSAQRPLDAAGLPAASASQPSPWPLDDTDLVAAIRWAATTCGSKLLHVEGLAGMALASLPALRREGTLRLVLSLHDFAAFCPRPHLLEIPPTPMAPRFCHYSHDLTRCAQCLATTWLGAAISPPESATSQDQQRPLADDQSAAAADAIATFQERRRALAAELLAEADEVVYPSPFLERQHALLFPGAGSERRYVISPALAACDSSPGDQTRSSRTPPAAPDRSHSAVATDAPASHAEDRGAFSRPQRSPLRVAWIGAVQPHKGTAVFEAAVRTLAGTGDASAAVEARRLGAKAGTGIGTVGENGAGVGALPNAEGGVLLSAYGGGDAAILRRWRRLPGLRVHGYYRSGSLPRLLRRDRIDLALLLSIVPESYGLALDECAAAGVPAIAFDRGALGERLRDTGLLLDAALADGPAVAAGGVLAGVLLDLAAGTLALPAALPPSPDASAAAAAWIERYRSLGALGALVAPDAPGPTPLSAATAKRRPEP